MRSRLKLSEGGLTMKLEQMINENYRLFSEGDELLARYILSHKDSIPQLSITDLAERCLSSKSSILRFSQKIGFSGYTEFKNYIRWEILNQINRDNEKDYGDIIKSQIEKTIDGIEIDYLKEVVREIDQSRNVYIAGTGVLHQNMAAELQRVFLGVGNNLQVIPLDINSSLHQLVVEQMTDEDMFIIFSSSGNNPIIKDSLSIPLIKEVKILGITASQSNWLATHANYNIHVYSEDDDRTGVTNIFSSSSFYCIIELLIFHYSDYKVNEN